jgi:hypothetical protein
MANRAPLRLDDSWIALPGLFTTDDLEGIDDLDVHAIPLVLRGTEVLYGVYLRERDARPSDAPPRRRRESIEPVAPR